MISILIYQHNTVNPTRGGISRMSTVYYDILTKAGYEVHFVSENRTMCMDDCRQLYCEGSTKEELLISFTNIVKQYRASLLIYQDGITPSYRYIVMFAKYCNIKVITMVHSSLRGIYGIGGRRIFSSLPLPLRKGVEMCVNQYFKFKYSSSYCEMFNNSDKVVLLSDRFKEEIPWFTGINDLSKFVAISNPLSIKSPISLPENKKKIVLNVALLSNAKRHDLLLKIWSKVEQKHTDWYLNIVGDGSLKDHLITMAQKLHLTHVNFCGFQSPEKYYEEASIFCLTSGYEGFGLVLVESMSYGCVTMAFNSFANACDIIENNKNGFLIDAFDINKYAERLEFIMNNAEHRRILALNSVEKSKDFSMDKISALWLNLIKELLEK